MPNDKANYEDTKYALTASQSLKSIVNQLTKISIKTEDSSLKKLIAPVLVGFNSALKIVDARKNANLKGVIATDSGVRAILDYCDRSINSVIPKLTIHDLCAQSRIPMDMMRQG